MKTELRNRIVVLAVVIIVIAALTMAFMMLKEQQMAMNDKIASLKTEVAGYRATFKILESKIKDLSNQSKGYADSIKNVQDKMGSSEQETKNLVAKIEALMQDVELLKGSKAGTVSKSSKSGAVELGEIPVRK